MANTRDGVKQDATFASAGADDGAVKDELVALEKRYWQAIQDNDFETALDLTDEPCIVTGAQGVASLNRDRFRELMKAASYKIEDVYFDPDVQVRMLGSDTAVLAYMVRERLTVDGKSITMEAADASTWVRRGGKWRCALHTESIKGDPFGRDRTAA